jgi:putative DNA primase/helicase
LKIAVETRLKEQKQIRDKEEREARDEDRKLARVEANAQSKAKAKRKLFQQLRGQSEQKREADIKLWCDTYKEDPDVLAEELTAYLAPTIDPPVETAEMWPEPVDGAALISQIERRITRHVLMISNAGTIGAAFWTLQTWLHSSTALFSAILAPWSAEAEQGKTTLLEVISWMVPRPHKEVTPTISLYQTIDADEPTLFIEEGEKLFKDRKLHEIINASWTRGSKVYRMIRGVRTPFRIFCPKAIALLGRNDVPTSSATRCIFIEMMAPTEDEKLEPFKHEDDEELREIRLKAARWAADHAADLKHATPSMPPGFVNRLANNWTLMFAIADLIGGDWPQQSRLAATQLAPIDDQLLTWSKRLLAEFRAVFEAKKRGYVTSKEIHEWLIADKLGPWGNYHGHPITQREIAHLLRTAYQIHHQKVGPADHRVWGYRAEDFAG